MRSSRVLLSDQHFHRLQLSEQQIGVLLHALEVLQAAFDQEPEYLTLINQQIDLLERQFGQGAVDKDCQPLP